MAKRWLKLSLAGFLVLLGIAGLFLPFLQGFLFLALGLLIFSRETVWGHRLALALRRRYPRTFARADRLVARLGKTLRGWRARIRGGVRR